MFTHHESPITNAEAIFGQARAVEQRQVLALYAETEKATAQLSINRSALIRSALQQFLDKWRRKELDRELAEGYIANASQARETAEAFSHVDSELL